MLSGAPRDWDDGGQGTSGPFGVLLGFGSLPLGEPLDFADFDGSGDSLGLVEADGSSVGFSVFVGSVVLGVGSGSGVSDVCALGLVDSRASLPLRAYWITMSSSSATEAPSSGSIESTSPGSARPVPSRTGWGFTLVNPDAFSSFLTSWMSLPTRWSGTWPSPDRR